MIRRIVFIIALSCILIPGSSSGQGIPAATQPTTQQIVLVQTLPAGPESLYDQVLKTRLGEIAQGKRTLTWADVRDPSFWYDAVRDLIINLVVFIPRLIGTCVFLFVFWLVYRGIRKVAMGNMKQGEVDSSIRDLLGAMIKWTVMGFGLVIACNQLGIPIVAMLTGVSIIGLAVGFAAQETLANFIAGIVIFLDKPFKIGDWIQLDNIFGQVRRVTFRATRLLTGDGEIVVVPNTQILSTRFSNHSTNPINRVSVPVGIAYKASIEEARRVLLDLVRDDTRILKNPDPEVIVKALADSSVNLVLRFWIDDESLGGRMCYEYLEKVKNALDAAGIDIPFPHMQLFIENTPAVAALAGNGKARGVN